MNALTEDDRLRLEERLCNWADWANQKSGGGDETCASAEGMYRSQGDSESLVAAARIRAIDADDAEKVERAVSAMPHSQSAYIKMRYLSLRTPNYLQRRLRYKADQQDAIHAKVLLSLKATLLQLSRSSSPLIRRGATHWAGLATR